MPARKARRSPAEGRTLTRRSPAKARAPVIVGRLRGEYPRGHPARPIAERRDPLEELVFTVLSQNTSDVNRDRAWASLRAAYPTWEDALAARPSRLAASITSGGLSNIKAPRIQTILREVLDREGRMSLARLRRVDDAEAAAYLRTLPGVGAKTVACVLAFSLGRPRMPVDTHVHRVAGRLGLIGATAVPEHAQEELEALIPPDDRLEAHVTFIAHGRSVCRAQRPLCATCLLYDLCPAGPRYLRA